MQLIFYVFSLISNDFTNINEYENFIICIFEHWMKVLCLDIQLVSSLKVSDELLLRYTYFCRDIPINRSALCVAMETMQFHKAQMSLFFRAIFLPIQVVFLNNLTHFRSFHDSTRLVLLDPRVLRNVYAVTFYRYKMYHIFGHEHYDIFILKQNNLLIIKLSF